MTSRKILNRVNINITNNDDNVVYKTMQDWCRIVEMQDEIVLKPNTVEFDFIPGYKFHGLKIAKPKDIIIDPLTFTFECDMWENNNEK